MKYWAIRKLDKKGDNQNNASANRYCEDIDGTLVQRLQEIVDYLRRELQRFQTCLTGNGSQIVGGNSTGENGCLLMYSKKLIYRLDANLAI